MIGYPKPTKIKRNKKKKKTEKQEAKDKAWKAFSDFIRHRDSFKTTGTFTKCMCITCGKVKPYKKTQAGHGIGGRTNSILFHEQIVNGQCDYCNVWKNGNYEIYATKLIERYGFDKYKDFLALKRVTVKYSALDYKNIAEMYKKKLKNLKETLSPTGILAK